MHLDGLARKVREMGSLCPENEMDRNFAKQIFADDISVALGRKDRAR